MKMPKLPKTPKTPRPPRTPKPPYSVGIADVHDDLHGYSMRLVRTGLDGWMEEMKAKSLVQVRSTKVLGTTYTRHVILYRDKPIHTQISALSDEDVAFFVAKYLAGPTPVEPLIRTKPSSPTGLKHAGEKARRATRFKKTAPVADPPSPFYIEDDAEA